MPEAQPHSYTRAALLALALAMAPLAACQAPAAQPAPHAPQARTVSLTFQLPPERRVQAATNAFTRGDIHHLVVKLYRVDGTSETLLKTADLPENRLDLPVTFSGLVGRTTYRVRCAAYRLPGTDPRDMISAPEGSMTEVAVADDDVVSIQPLKVQLLDVMPLVATPIAGDAVGSDAQGVSLDLITPEGLALDASGTVYIADTDRHVIRQINASGALETIAGTAGTPGATDAADLSASFNRPMGMAVDGAGNLIVADRDNHRIRKITPAGVVSTLAGSTQGDLDATGTSARFNFPKDVAIAPDATIYVADTGNYKIRKIDTSGNVTNFAGSGSVGYMDGPSNQAQFDAIVGLEVDASGVLYVAEQENTTPFKHRVRRIRPDGYVTTLIGQGCCTVDPKGSPDSEIMLPMPYAIALDRAGHLYVTTSDGILRRNRRGQVRFLKGYKADGSASGYLNHRAIVVGDRGPIVTINNEAQRKVIRLK